MRENPALEIFGELLLHKLREGVSGFLAHQLQEGVQIFPDQTVEDTFLGPAAPIR